MMPGVVGIAVPGKGSPVASFAAWVDSTELSNARMPLLNAEEESPSSWADLSYSTRPKYNFSMGSQLPSLASLPGIGSELLANEGKASCSHLVDTSGEDKMTPVARRSPAAAPAAVAATDDQAAFRCFPPKPSTVDRARMAEGRTLLFMAFAT